MTKLERYHERLIKRKDSLSHRILDITFENKEIRIKARCLTKFDIDQLKIPRYPHALWIIQGGAVDFVELQIFDPNNI